MLPSPGLDSYFNFSSYIDQKIQQNQPKKQKLKLASHGKTRNKLSYQSVLNKIIT